MYTTLTHGINSGKLTLVPASNIPLVFPRLKQLMSGNRHEWEYYVTPEQLLLDSAATRELWVAPATANFNAFILLEVLEYPTGNKDLGVAIATGMHITPHIPLFHAAAICAAEKYGCKRITLSGRLAFQRLLAKHGYKPSPTQTLTYEVKNVLRQAESRADQ